MSIALTPMEPLRAEHRALLPSIDGLARVAAEASAAEPEVLRTEVDRIVDFLRHHLLPHAAAEDDVLYPAVDRVMGVPGATATMRRDHVEVGRLIDELIETEHQMGAPIDDELRQRLAGLLHSLHAIVALHFAKEEEIYVPLLDERLTAAEGAALLDEMELAAARYRAA